MDDRHPKPSDDREDQDEHVDLTEDEAEQVDRRQTAAARVVHEVIRREGDEELKRPALSLMWSGLAGGVGITASVMGKSVIESHLPDTQWRSLIASFGYCLGFLIVIMGRLQLFTESTLSAVIPVATRPNLRNLGRLLRLWSIVLVANVAGTFLIALMIHWQWIGTDASHEAMIETSRDILSLSGGAAVSAGVPAGFLMAAISWALPTARRQEFFIIVFFTYFIALGGFAHVIAGSGEAWLLWLSGDVTLGWALGGYMLPALIGNILGGAVLFALLAHAQVRQEL